MVDALVFSQSCFCLFFFSRVTELLDYSRRVVFIFNAKGTLHITRVFQLSLIVDFLSFRTQGVRYFCVTLCEKQSAEGRDKNLECCSSSVTFLIRPNFLNYGQVAVEGEWGKGRRAYGVDQRGARTKRERENSLRRERKVIFLPVMVRFESLRVFEEFPRTGNSH